VVVYYRGGWCPFATPFQEMQKVLRAIHGKALLMTISRAASTALRRRRNKLTFPLLNDKGNAVARQFAIVYRVSDQEIPFYDAAFDSTEHNRDRGYELPLAATYVIDTGGVIRYAFLDADFSHRAKPQTVLDVLRRLKRNLPDPRPARPAPVERTASQAGGARGG
jgi:peroxiredoxin